MSLAVPFSWQFRLLSRPSFRDFCVCFHRHCPPPPPLSPPPIPTPPLLPSTSILLIVLVLFFLFLCHRCRGNAGVVFPPFVLHFLIRWPNLYFAFLMFSVLLGCTCFRYKIGYCYLFSRSSPPPSPPPPTPPRRACCAFSVPSHSEGGALDCDAPVVCVLYTPSTTSGIRRRTIRYRSQLQSP